MSTPPPTPPSSSMAERSVKRRRTDAAATLSKPFRSPLLQRKPAAGGTSMDTSMSPPTLPTKTPSRVPSNPRYPATPLSSQSQSPTKPSRSSNSTSSILPSTSTSRPTPTPLSRRPAGSLRPPPSIASPLKPSDPALSAAQKAHTNLTLSIRSAKASLDAAKQALALEKSNDDARLEAEIIKWRFVSREVAETLFGIAGDRINQLGGPGGDALKRMLGGGGGGRSYSGGSYGNGRGGGGGGSWGWDDDDKKRMEGYEDDGYVDDGDEGIGGEQQAEEERKEKEKREEDWSVGVMLRSLGIPDEMLGWDREASCWKELDA